MLVIDNGDAIRGIAEVATKLDYIVNGYVGTTATQLSDGQLGTSEADLYLSGANAIVVTSITIVNRDSAARTFTLYLKPSGGTSRAITPVSLDLGIGHSFYTDGQRIVVLDKSGNLLTVAAVTAHDLGGAFHNADTLTNLNTKISDATLVDTDSIILRALLTTQNDIITRNGSNPIRLNIGASRFVARLAAGNLVAATVAEILTLLGVEAGATADLTGDEIVTLLEALAGAARLSHTSISDIGATDHHTKYADAEAVVAVEAAGLTFAENKGIILDALLSGDEKWSGISEIGTMGYGATVGDLVYLAVADTKWELTDADAAATSKGKIGLVLATTSENSTCQVLLYGKMRSAAFPAFTVGAPVHVGLTAGDVQVAAPTVSGDIVRIIGYGNTAEDLFFCPDNTYIELA